MPTPLSQKFLKSILLYNPKTGIFVWRINRPPRGFAGKRAGIYRPDGYETIGINGGIYYSHRLAWLYMTGRNPRKMIDHADRNPSNNSWKNIREATHSENLCNHGANKNNKSGSKGIYKRKDCNRWSAFIDKNKKRNYLGLFRTQKEAEIAYREAAKKLHGDFAFE